MPDAYSEYFAIWTRTPRRHSLVMAFIRNSSQTGREMGLAVLAGEGINRKRYPLDQIEGLVATLATLSSDPDSRVRGAARTLLVSLTNDSNAKLGMILEGLTDSNRDAQFKAILAFEYDANQFKGDEKSRRLVASALIGILEQENTRSSIPTPFSLSRYSGTCRTRGLFP